MAIESSMGPVSYLTIVVLLLSSAVGGLEARLYSVTQYGARGDGKTDDTKAFMAAWKATCKDAQAPTLLVPSGRTFILGQATFAGHCNSKIIYFKIDGNISRPRIKWAGIVESWILFYIVNGLRIHGSGQIDGQGAFYWPCKRNHQCQISPNTMVFIGCNNTQLSGLKFINSPSKHVAFDYCFWVTVNDVTIISPWDSPNTDGVYIQQCQHVKMWDLDIGTGDDCIAIGQGSKDVHTYWVRCGPGHGISIGSLGEYNSRAEVENVHVYHSKFYNTTNGVRIKTWPGGSGYAKDISFEHVKFTCVQNPIIIDQYYKCGNCANQKSAVHISGVQYIDVKGTSSSKIAINLHCSKSVACKDITMDDIDIRPADSTKKATTYCLRAHGREEGVVNPKVPCLT